MKVKILKPVFGIYRIAAFPGHTVEVDDSLAEELIEKGYAQAVEVKEVKKAVAKKETATLKPRKRSTRKSKK